jgi:hypothetical protein
MSDQLIPPPELAPRTRSELTFEQRIAAWVDLVRLGDQLVLAGLQNRIGGGDPRAAYRDWYRRRMEEHDEAIIHMLREFDRRWRRDGE